MVLAGVALSTVPCNPHSCSGCCCCAVCVSPCPFLGDFAGVAVFSTPMAITAHLAPELGSREERLCPREWCREAGARVTTNVLVRDLDLGVPEASGGRRLEVVADGLPLFGGAQLAVDTTLVSALHCDGSARAGAAHRDGVALEVARRRKERTYPEWWLHGADVV